MMLVVLLGVSITYGAFSIFALAIHDIFEDIGRWWIGGESEFDGYRRGLIHATAYTPPAHFASICALILTRILVSKEVKKQALLQLHNHNNYLLANPQPDMGINLQYPSGPMEEAYYPVE
eukprot:CAMPEP_0205801686 /NCGR_PEP_ID=MMETSP0205-20121125/3750_1 /ASSEMBLY_ACC=CAM_ASM_000278 /TAXON_ID=36767 /ORGANISM="Euplotes focardii, Strain TN1" /LENGTH=119 /DNA_ID=CAMNT_0053066833 /DNA_START=268 /DNA_END=624 /DNA_ORIENTATION=+